MTAATNKSGRVARPILMSSPMILALLGGRKTQTRRIIKPAQPRGDGLWPAGRDPVVDCPYGKPGDLLWVRETWQLHSRASDLSKVVYRASETASHTEFCRYVPTDLIGNTQPKPFQEGWRSSIHMPRWASRLTLELTVVRVQRLQEISEEDARAEGCPVTWDGKHYEPPSPDVDSWQGYGRASYCLLWNQINGIGAWDVNPWVWALSFQVLQQNVDAMLGGRRSA